MPCRICRRTPFCEPRFCLIYYGAEGCPLPLPLEECPQGYVGEPPFCELVDCNENPDVEGCEGLSPPVDCEKNPNADGRPTIDPPPPPLFGGDEFFDGDEGDTGGDEEDGGGTRIISTIIWRGRRLIMYEKNNRNMKWLNKCRNRSIDHGDVLTNIADLDNR